MAYTPHPTQYKIVNYLNIVKILFGAFFFFGNLIVILQDKLCRGQVGLHYQKVGQTCMLEIK